MRRSLLALTLIIVVSLVTALSSADEGNLTVQPLAGFVATLTTNPDPLPPSEGTLIVTLTRNNTPVAGERVTLRLEGRKHTLVETDVVTDTQGQVRIVTYFASAGEYTLLITNGNDTASFPVRVRGTIVLVTGFIIALGILLALLFEKRLP